jgi:hypothetical protein
MDKCTYEVNALRSRLELTRRLAIDIEPAEYRSVSERLIAVELVKHSLQLALEELTEILDDLIAEQEEEILGTIDSPNL